MVLQAKGFLTQKVRVTIDPSKGQTSQIQSPIRRQVWYPDQISLEADRLDFGVIHKPEVMMRMFTATKSSDLPRLTVNFRKRIFSAHFTADIKDPRPRKTANGQPQPNYGQLNRCSTFKFQIPFEHLSRLQYLVAGDELWIVVSLPTPPPFWWKRPDVEKSHTKDSLAWAEADTWVRTTGIVYNPRALMEQPVELNDDKAFLDIGQWTTYRFVFSKKGRSWEDFSTLAQALRDFNIPVEALERFSAIPRHQNNIVATIDSTQFSKRCGLSFEARYQLEVCLSHVLLSPQNLTPAFFEALATVERQNFGKARAILEHVAESSKRVFEPMTLFEDEAALTFPVKSKIPPYCAWVRKATITPTTIYYSTPVVETSNRVLRHFAKYGDRFLRVQFTDEPCEGRINSCADKETHDQIFLRVHRALIRGIKIGDRHYEFLAFGNSQIREHGAYFFCPPKELSCDDIRKWMGDFRHIPVVAKYAARLGQCFSTTRAVPGIGGIEIVEIADIERNGYCFTDGVGKISAALAQKIAHELSLTLRNSPPSAYQFRLGGCKGVLAVAQDVQGAKVYIRKSQLKFRAIYNGLEIIRPSRFSVATLNRQIILILDALGVEEESFHRILDAQLNSHRLALSDKVVAIDLLSRNIDENHMTLTLSSMIADGFMDAKEPFFMSLLHLWHSWSMKLMKEKAKIPVEQGAFVLGCVDETGTLKGHSNADIQANERVGVEKLPQIFLQIPERTQPGRYRVVEGVCLLGRNPSLHPGDIRIVNAVNVPQLQHLRDVVVFPQQGDRDIPSMCSGGDLDGDDFFVIWDPDLIPSRWNVAPMDYTAPNPRALDRPVVVKDLVDFFALYMKNDTLPAIAHAHLAQADYFDNGVDEQQCLDLAALHSKAVDFVKSGEPAVMPKSLRPRMWPHFMEKKYKPKEAIYTSKKILGQLYDKVDRVAFKPLYELKFDSRILKAYRLDDPILKTARQTKKSYDIAMRKIMAQHEIETEFEVWSTFVLSKPRVGSDYKLQEVMDSVSSSLKDEFRAICIENAGGSDSKQLGPFVAAMYRVTWEQVQLALHECRTTTIVGGRPKPLRKMAPTSMPLVSFPWLFPEVMGQIAKKKEPQVQMEQLNASITAALLSKKATTLDDMSFPENDGQGAFEKDVLTTATGVAHRGDLLNLFESDDEDQVELSAMEHLRGLIFDDNPAHAGAQSLHDTQASFVESPSTSPPSTSDGDADFSTMSPNIPVTPYQNSDAGSMEMSSKVVDIMDEPEELLGGFPLLSPQKSMAVKGEVGSAFDRLAALLAEESLYD